MVIQRRPVNKDPIVDMEGFIDHLIPMLKNHLANDVANVFFGDLPMYLPSAFQGPRKENKAVIAVSPTFDRLDGNNRVASMEFRELGVDIIGFVNITPELKAQPTEAYGERNLVRLMRKTRTFLTQQANVQLDGRVRYLDVGNVTWAWRIDPDAGTSLRGAGLEVSAKVKVDRQ